MIRETEEEGELFGALAGLPNDLFTGKLRALAKGYGLRYPFLRFYLLGRCGVLAGYYGAAVLSGAADAETADFVRTGRFRELFLPESAYRDAFSAFPAKRLNILKYGGKAEALTESGIRINPPYEAVFEILRDGFPELRFDVWYPDACHNVRHGIAAFYTLGGSAAECAFAENGTAMLTAVAAKRDARGTGRTLRLVKALAAHYARENEVFLVCEDPLLGFYEKADFQKSGSAYLLRPAKRNLLPKNERNTT